MRRLVALAVVGLSACGDGDTLTHARLESVAADAARPKPGDVPAEPERDDGDGTAEGAANEADAATDDGEMDASLPEPSPPRASLDAGEPVTMDSSAPTEAGGGDTIDGGVSAVEASFAAELADAQAEAAVDAAADVSAAADASTAADASDSGDSAPAADGATGDASIAARFLDRLYACGALGPGEYHPRPVVDDFRRCTTECVIAAPCSDVRHYLCREEAPLIDECQFACPVAPVTQAFMCGDGQQVWLGLVCDGLANCANRRDEQDCPTFTCSNGDRVLGPARCDGRRGCSDGSDELGCASTCPAPSG